MLPLKTTREGDQITKVCVEDVYKISNRVLEGITNCYNNIIDIVDSIHKEYDGYEGKLIIGTGVSKPCADDKFDEKIGNELAFRKAKLNANLKIDKILRRITNEYIKGLGSLSEDIWKVNSHIDSDLLAIREHNPEYLIKKRIHEDC